MQLLFGRQPFALPASMSLVLATDEDELLSAMVLRPRTDRTTIAKTTSSRVEEHAVTRTRRGPADGSHDDLPDAGGGGAGELFREDREGEGVLVAAGVARGSNFDEAWGVRVGRPGSSPGTAG